MANSIALLPLHEAVGVWGAELWVNVADADTCWQQLLEIGRSASVRPVGLAAVEVLRIEAGIPWLGEDIDDAVLPAETLQDERGIHHSKGCYLGQEIVERMRSRGSLARHLTGVRLDGSRLPRVPSTITVAGAEAGRVPLAARRRRRRPRLRQDVRERIGHTGGHSSGGADCSGTLSAILFRP